MKRLLTFAIFILMSVNLWGQSKAQLPQPIINEFAERFKLRFEYDENFMRIILIFLRQKNPQLSIEGIDNIVENIANNERSRDLIFKTYYDIARGYGPAEDFLYGSLRDLGLQASSASILKKFIFEKYEMERIKKVQQEEKEQQISEKEEQIRGKVEQDQLRVRYERQETDRKNAKNIEIKEYDKQQYDTYAEKIKENILNDLNLQSSTSNNYYRFKNTYNVYFKHEAVIPKIVKSGDSYFEESDNSLGQIKKITLVSGTDSVCSLFSNISIDMPTIRISGIDYNSEVSFDEMNVDYAKGSVAVKIRHHSIYFLDYVSDKDIREKIVAKLKDLKPGKYHAYFSISNILGEERNSIEFVKDKQKFGKGWYILGGLLILSSFL